MMMNIDTFKATVSLEMLADMINEIEVVFDRCFLESFYLEPDLGNGIHQMVANYKGGAQRSYDVPATTLMELFTAESFGRAFNLLIKKLPSERL